MGNMPQLIIYHYIIMYNNYNHDYICFFKSFKYMIIKNNCTLTQLYFTYKIIITYYCVLMICGSNALMLRLAFLIDRNFMTCALGWYYL